MINRDMTSKVRNLAKKMPVIALVGPRQSGKTTLSRAIFKEHQYISLENLSMREFAQKDPYSFFKTYHNEFGIILDEIQEVPELLSYIQVHVDEFKRPGYFVLTGSQNFLVLESITQTLAGRIAIFTLLPLSIAELKNAQLLPQTIEDYIFKGQYPRLYAYNLAPSEWYPDYVKTYVERDVRTIRNVADLVTFQRFIGLCAGRIGQLLNITSLANDCGITVATTKAWLSLLEASYIIFLLQPYYQNVGKRLVKAPKIYFYDVGLACSVLGIESVTQIVNHYLRGGLVESLILSEFYKQRYNQGLQPNMYFWRDKIGHEIDCLMVFGDKMLPIEIKAGKTISQNYFDGLNYWYDLFKITEKNGIVAYAGDENQQRRDGRVVRWYDIDTIKVR